MLFALVAVLLFIKVGNGIAGKVVVSWLTSVNYLDAEAATKIYSDFISHNMSYIIVGATIVFFLILFWFQLGWFTKYFDEVIKGVDLIAKGSDEEIVMCPEMSFISDNLNNVKYRLMRGAMAEKEAEQRKRDLVLYLAHDIKTPLTSIVGYLSLLDESEGMTIAKRKEYTHIALEKAYRLEGLINEFFDIARYNLSDMPINKSSVDLGYMLIQIVDEAYPQLKEKGKKVDLDVEDDLVITVDSQKMARVFNNLLKNAISYGENDSDIHMSAKRYGRGVFISVKSKGEIAPNMLDKIFDKFFRTDASRQSITGGSGLGLAISRDIVTLHGGTIRAKNQNGYAVFTMFLPDVIGEGEEINSLVSE